MVELDRATRGRTRTAVLIEGAGGLGAGRGRAHPGRQQARLSRIVARTLAEDHGRTADSPLLVHDAWVRWRAGDPAGAVALLDEAAPAAGPVGRDRALVRAGLAAEVGDRPTAERLLAGIADEALWPDPLSALAVQAARVRLTVDLDAEHELAERSEGLWTREPGGQLVTAIRARVAPGDVLLPSLGAHVAGLTTFPLHIPERRDELAEFALTVHPRRRRLRDHRPDDTPTGAPPGHVERVRELADRLGEQGEHRWQLATTTPLLIGLRDRAVAAASAPPDPLTLAVVASLAAFRGLPLTIDSSSSRNIDDLLGGVYHRARALQAEADRSDLAWSITAGEQQRSGARGGTSSPAIRTVLLYVLSPDPLILLIRRALGLPDDESER